MGPLGNVSPRSIGGIPGGEAAPLTPPQHPPLSTSSSIPTGLDRVKENVELSVREAPENGVLHEMTDSIKELSIGDILFGVSGKDLKENIKKAWKTDGHLPLPLRALKTVARATGLVPGLLLNFTSRIVAFAVAAAVAPVIMVWYSLGIIFGVTDSTIWKNPREVLKMMAGLGAGAGAATGALIGSLGNLLVKTAISMEYEKEETVFSKAMLDGMAAGLIGSFIGTAASCANPIFIRALWIPDTYLHQ